MTTTTRPIPLFRAGETSAPGPCLRGLLTCARCHSVPACFNDTHPIVLADAQVRRWNECSPTGGLSSMQTVAVAALVALRRAMADDELSRPLDLPDLRRFALCHDVGHVTTPFQQVAQPTVIVDAGEPPPCPAEEEPTLEYSWSRARRKIRAAARAYSEQTHADY
jgi:hypothetical protein